MSPMSVLRAGAACGIIISKQENKAMHMLIFHKAGAPRADEALHYVYSRMMGWH